MQVSTKPHKIYVKEGAAYVRHKGKIYWQFTAAMPVELVNTLYYSEKYEHDNKVLAIVKQRTIQMFRRR